MARDFRRQCRERSEGGPRLRLEALEAQLAAVRERIAAMQALLREQDTRLNG